jgi:hypothetical protein
MLRALVLASLLVGCATPHTRVIPPTEVQILVHPWVPPVRLVSKRPPRDRYSFVGRVRASVSDDEFVEAANAVRAQLVDRARKLGASVVKIDVVGAKSGRVLLAGRAYRTIN